MNHHESLMMTTIKKIILAILLFGAMVLTMMMTMTMMIMMTMMMIMTNFTKKEVSSYNAVDIR